MDLRVVHYVVRQLKRFRISMPFMRRNALLVAAFAGWPRAILMPRLLTPYRMRLTRVGPQQSCAGRQIFAVAA